MGTRDLTEQYMLRLPEGWRSQIKAIAAGNRRSINQEILIVLDCALGLAAGAVVGAETPAARSEIAALEGGASDQPDEGSI